MIERFYIWNVLDLITFVYAGLQCRRERIIWNVLDLITFVYVYID